MLDEGDIPIDLFRAAAYIGARLIAPMSDISPSDFGIITADEEIGIALKKQLASIGGIDDHMASKLRNVVKSRGVKQL